MSAILKAIPPIGNIMILLIFFIVFYGIIGLDFYAGAFHSACYDGGGENAMDGQLCKLNFTLQNMTEWVAQAPFACPPETTCAVDALGPNSGITKFDTIVYGMLTVFQIITLEGWSDLLYIGMPKDFDLSWKSDFRLIFCLKFHWDETLGVNTIRPGYYMGNFSTSGRNLETGSWLFAIIEKRETPCKVRNPLASLVIHDE